jgi:hypothetical protein
MAQLLIGPLLAVTATNVTGTNLTVSSTANLNGPTNLNGGGTLPAGQTLINSGTIQNSGIISGGAVNPSTLQTSGNATVGGSLTVTKSLASVGGVTSAGTLGTGLIVATVDNLQITTTSATTILTFTPTSAGSFRVEPYLYVVTAATTVTLTLTWTDAGGARSDTLINAVSEPVGPVLVQAVVVESVANQAITLSITAGTANQVYASCRIIAH